MQCATQKKMLVLNIFIYDRNEKRLNATGSCLIIYLTLWPSDTFFTPLEVVCRFNAWPQRSWPSSRTWCMYHKNKNALWTQNKLNPFIHWMWEQCSSNASKSSGLIWTGPNQVEWSSGRTLACCTEGLSPNPRWGTQKCSNLAFISRDSAACRLHATWS